jgi:hypothetical protein
MIASSSEAAAFSQASHFTYARPLPGLLEHLGGNAQVSGLLVGVGGTAVLLLLGEDGTRGVEPAGLEVELGRLEEAILVVADLGGPLELAAVGEILRRLLEQSALEGQLRCLEGLSLPRERSRRAGRPLAGARIAREIPWPRVRVRRRRSRAARQQGPDQQHEPQRSQPEAAERCLQGPLEAEREVARQGEGLDPGQLLGTAQDGRARTSHQGLLRLVREAEREESSGHERRARDRDKDASNASQQRHASQDLPARIGVRHKSLSARGV